MPGSRDTPLIRRPPAIGQHFGALMRLPAVAVENRLLEPDICGSASGCRLVFATLYLKFI